MECRLVSFGQIEIDGQRFDHDVVIEDGRVRRRKKGPSKRRRAEYGHTPLSPDEAIPWSALSLIVGTGASGQLPITDDFYREAARRQVEVVARPTAEACELFAAADAGSVAAILHVTCWAPTSGWLGGLWTNVIMVGPYRRELGDITPHRLAA